MLRCPKYLCIDFPPKLRVILAKGLDNSLEYLDKFLLFEVSRRGIESWGTIKHRLMLDSFLSSNPVYRTKSESFLRNRYYFVLKNYAKFFKIKVRKLYLSQIVEKYDFQRNFKIQIQSSKNLTNEESSR